MLNHPGGAWASSKLHLEYLHRYEAICPAELLWLQGHRLSFTVKPWESRRIHAIMNGHARCVPETSVQPALSRDHQTPTMVKFPCMLPMDSTGIVFALTLFHADPEWAVALQARSDGLAELHVSMDMQSLWNIWIRWFKTSGKLNVVLLVDWFICELHYSTCGVS